MSQPDLSILKQYVKDNLAIHLLSLEGKKDLFLDEELMKPLDHITGVSFLRQHGVEKIYLLQPGGIEHGCESRIFIIRPYHDRMKLLADSINFDKDRMIKRNYHIVFTPRKLSTCDMILEQEGIYGDVTTDEYPLDVIPLDVDLLSLEMPLCYKQFFLDSDMTWFHSIARAVCTLQGTFGTIPKCICIGEKSKMLHTLLTLMMSDERDYNPPGGAEIGAFIMIDRDIDNVSMLCSQLTYEGLVAETFGIKSGIVEFTKEVTGSDQTARLNLNSSDQVFAEIRGMHVTTVFPLLSHKAKQLQCGYEKRNNLESVKDFKQFVAEDLKKLKQQHKSLALHIGACEAIMSRKNAVNFEDLLHVEQCLLDDSEYKECLNYIETCINRQNTDCLRLLCMLSLCKGGIDTKQYKTLKIQYLQSFGYNNLLTLKRLKDVGLYTENSDKRNIFPKIRKKFNLIPKDPEAVNKSTNPKDISYVFGGAYSPFLVKLIEQLVSRGLAGSLEETLRSFQINSFEHRHPSSAREVGSTIKTSASAVKTVLIILVGGCTHTEVNTLRFVARQLGYKFIVMTTAIVTAQEFLKTISVS